MFKSKKMKKDGLSDRDSKRVHDEFNSFKDKAYSEDDMNKVFNNEDKIMGKMNDENLKAFIEDVKLFFMMLKDFFTRKYTEIPVGTIMAIAGSLLYVLAPFDVIPDWIPGLGYLDDAGVITLCLNFVKNDLEKYKEFKGIKQ